MKTKNLESRLRAAIRREIKIAIAEEVKGEVIFSDTFDSSEGKCTVKVATDGPMNSVYVYNNGEKTTLAALKQCLSATDYKTVEKATKQKLESSIKTGGMQLREGKTVYSKNAPFAVGTMFRVMNPNSGEWIIKINNIQYHMGDVEFYLTMVKGGGRNRPIEKTVSLVVFEKNYLQCIIGS